MGFDKLLPCSGRSPSSSIRLMFERTDSVREIIFSRANGARGGFEELVRQTNSKVRRVVPGGNARLVRAGLSIGTDTKFIAVHDAARPLVTPEQIERVSLVRELALPPLASPITDTLKRADENSCYRRCPENLYVDADSADFRA